MVRRLLPLLLSAAVILFAAPRVLVDNDGYAELSHVENPGRPVLGEGVDDAADKRSSLSLRSSIEYTVAQFPVSDFFPICRSLKQRHASGYDLQLYALNCRIII